MMVRPKKKKKGYDGTFEDSCWFWTVQLFVNYKIWLSVAGNGSKTVGPLQQTNVCKDGYCETFQNVKEVVLYSWST